MPMTYHEQTRYQKLALVRLLFVANVAFAALVLVAWQFTLVLVLGPISWASDQPVPSSLNLSRLLDYPLVLYWAAPALAMATAWLMLQSRRYRAAFGILALPILIMVITMVMYWAVPAVGR